MVNFMDIKQILETESIKDVRDALIEASHTFAPGSISDVVYKFNKAILDYYFDLACHEFQLYSDRPTYFMNPVYCHVAYEDGSDRMVRELHSDKKIDFSDLADLNRIPAMFMSKLNLKYELNPNLQYLHAEIQNDYYASLFTKNRTFAVKSGSKDYLEGLFNPSWSDGGLLIKSVSFMKDTGSATGIHGLSYITKNAYI